MLRFGLLIDPKTREKGQTYLPHPVQNAYKKVISDYPILT
jgi:hypothetical protein